MLVDAHVHLQPHGEKPPVDRARLEAYVEHAARAGLDVICITEHLFRFREAYELLDGWWEADPSPAMRAAAHAYWADHVSMSLPEYVRLIEEAKADGQPVRLGLEMDWIPGRADDLRALLAPYAWDVVLGSVHSVGAFMFDVDDQIGEWDGRDVAAVWDEYAGLFEELADAHLVDVLAHPDVIKVFGHRPPDVAPFNRRIANAAIRSGAALEINTNGLRKPAAELYPHPDILRAVSAAGVPVTLASDAHIPERLGGLFDAAIAYARAAGYTDYAVFDRRTRSLVPLPTKSNA